MKKLIVVILIFVISTFVSEPIFPQEKDVKHKDLTYAVFAMKIVNLTNAQNEKLSVILRNAFVDKLKLDGYKLIKNEVVDSVLGNKITEGLAQDEIVKISKSLNADVAIQLNFMVRNDIRSRFSDFFDIFIYAIDVHSNKLIWFDTKSGFFNLLNSDELSMHIAWDFIHRLESLGY
jgi:hypothetical protein